MSNDTIYVHAIYWAIVTVSHIGVGDISAITVNERLLNCLVILVGTFAYAILFGNIASLVSDLTGQLRSKLHHNYQYVMNFLQKQGLRGKFGRKVDEYFTYIWHANKGVDDDTIVNDLPASLKSDIYIASYANVVN